MSNTNIEDFKRLQRELQSRSEALVIVESVLSICIPAAALIGNSLVILLIWRNPRMRTATNLLIACIAISDVLFCALCSPLFTTVIITGRWLFHDVVCQAQGFFVTSLSCISILTLNLMAVNRYYRIVRHTEYRRVFSLRRTKIMIACAWICGLLATVPYLVSGKRFAFHPGKYFCHLTADVPFMAIVVLVYVCASLLLIGWCYYKVYMVIRSHHTQVSSSLHSSLRLTVDEIKITHVLFFTVVSFALCWIPVIVVDVIDAVNQSAKLPRLPYLLYTFFGSSSFAMDPIIYGLCNKSVRDGVLKLLRLKKQEQEQTTDRQHSVFVTDRN